MLMLRSWCGSHQKALQETKKKTCVCVRIEQTREVSEEKKSVGPLAKCYSHVTNIICMLGNGRKKAMKACEESIL